MLDYRCTKCNSQISLPSGTRCCPYCGAKVVLIASEARKLRIEAEEKKKGGHYGS